MTRATLALAACVGVAVAGAASLRLPDLGRRPPHPDEGNQFVKTGTLYDLGIYTYDPHDNHGPTLYYAALGALAASGAEDFAETTEAAYRVVPALFGVALVLLVLAMADGLGRPATVGAAILLAASPAMVYYSRYYIQEVMLVVFTLGAIASAWRYAKATTDKRAAAWAAAGGAMLGLAFATKETWVLALPGMAAGLAAARGGGKGGVRVRARHVALALGAFAAVWLLFFSSFLTNPKGLADAFLAYVYYATERAGGAGLHDHPWHWYLARLAYFHDGPGPHWTEGLVLALAAVGTGAAAAGKVGRASVPFVRGVAAFTIVTTAAYAIVPYKTPWCALTFLAGMALLAGVGGAALVRWARPHTAKAAVLVLLAAGVAHLAWQAHAASFDRRFFADPRNPYAYAHTSPMVERLLARLEALAAVAPAGRATPVQTIVPGNYWPLPWYLRGWSRTGWWREVPARPDAPILIVQAEVSAEVAARARGDDQTGLFALRPGVLLELRVERDLWDRFMEARGGPPAGEGGP